MSAGDPELAELIERCAGGEGEEADWRRLRESAADPLRRQAIAADLRLASRLHGLLRAPDPALGDRVLQLVAAQGTARRQRTLRGVERRLRRRRVLRWLPLAAAALLLLGVGAALLRPGSGDLPRCLPDPGAEIVADGALLPDGGQRVEAGTRIAVRSGSARMRWEDGSELMLAGDGSLRIEDPAQGKLLLLERGRVEAQVAAQPAGRPFRLRSPLARIEVLGTRFALSADDGLTRLRVEEGRVRFAALSGGEALLVVPGREAEVPASGPARWVGGGAIPPAGGSVRVVADADGTACKYYPNQVSGREESLLVKLDPPGQQGLTREAFLRFPVAHLRGKVERAWLHLYISEDRPPTRQAVAVVEGAFSEDSLCWNNRPARGRQLADWLTGPVGPLRLDLGRVLDSGSGDLLLRIYGLEAGNRNLAHYAAREHANPAWRPTLELALRPDAAAGAMEAPAP